MVVKINNRKSLHNQDVGTEVKNVAFLAAVKELQ